MKQPAHNSRRTPRSTTGHDDQPLSLAVLLETAQSVQGRLESMMEEVGLTPAKFQAIDALARAGEPLTLGEFASRLKCVRSNITQLVDRLEADGLVKRVNDPADRRAVRAVVTPLGLKRQAAGAKVVARLQEDLSKRVSPEERVLLHRLLGALQ
jgi:DNA-binding MarR family transcriptional regulator